MTNTVESENKLQSIQKLEKVANLSSKNERISFNRKQKNMEKLIKQIQPIEQKILDLIEEKIPIFDEIQQLRQKMVETCTHPLDYLVDKGDYVECKFCNKKIRA